MILSFPYLYARSAEMVPPTIKYLRRLLYRPSIYIRQNLAILSMDQNLLRLFFDSPVEIQVMILGQLSIDELEKALSVTPQLMEVIVQEFPSFVRLLFEEYPNMPYTLEIRHLVYHIVSLGASSELPFMDSKKGPQMYANWIKEFSNRSDDTMLPAIPRTLASLSRIQLLLQTVESWVGRLHFNFSRSYPSQDPQSFETFLRTQEMVLLHGSDSQDEHSFSAVESYRIRRALLLYELYCTLFFYYNHNTPNRKKRDGRVPEQMLFFQSLQPFLLAELDAIYGMIEGYLDWSWRLYEIPCRVSLPLYPGRGVRSAGETLEFIMSKGLESLAREVFNPRFMPEGYTDEVAIHMYCLRCMSQNPTGNSFFTTPLGYCSSDYQGIDCIRIPTMIPTSMVSWRGAPDRTNGPSWLYRTYFDPDEKENRDRIEALINKDPHNWMGLAFWEEDRLNRHFKLTEEARISGIDPKFQRSDYELTNGPTDAYREWLIFMDVPNVGYISTQLPESAAAIYRSTLG
ncbi:hypothetical protein F5Y00DRAFT_244639 [Daldinia vernicosa]|uniref:uncharacterized protein n=1 Tax=Daldinia vernicosa TaxID=114800 RepID=UPI0020089696|nr:uncharacterized protein F5Y00DRAFT_244639 [Daldinia vernicosa]KAI0846136.1 hypothetical protein F5Y00DRAFT_244639 [Daldinia vernicosa]